jgi:hypothetical protein
MRATPPLSFTSTRAFVRASPQCSPPSWGRSIDRRDGAEERAARSKPAA